MARQALVFGDADELGLLHLAEVVVEPLGRNALQFGQFPGRPRLPPQRLQEPDPQRIGQRPMERTAPELHSTLHRIDYLIGGIDLLDSLIVGTIRGFTVRLYQRDGAPWYRYGPATIALWLLSILIRVGLAILGSAHHASPLTEGSDLLFMLGLALLCQNVVVARRHALG